MGVNDQIRRLIVVPGHVQVGHPLRRDLIDELTRIVAVIDAVHVDVVDVQQQIAVGFAHDAEQEIRLADFAGQRCVEGGVLHRNAAAQDVLGAAHASGYVPERIFGKGNRQQIVEMGAVAAPAQVLAVEQNAMLVEKALEALQEDLVQWIRTTQR